MPEWFASIFEWLVSRDPVLVYLFLFINAAFESFFPPYPSDGVVLIISFLAGQGAYNPFYVYLATLFGSFIGVMVIYYLGRYEGRRLVLLIRIFNARHIQATENIFKKYGEPIIFLNRFLPGLRAPICFVAGISKIQPVKMVLFSFISIAIWNGILIPVGFAFGSNWERASSFLKSYNLIAWLIITIPLIVIFSIYLLRKWIVKSAGG